MTGHIWFTAGKGEFNKYKNISCIYISFQVNVLFHRISLP